MNRRRNIFLLLGVFSITVVLFVLYAPWQHLDGRFTGQVGVGGAPLAINQVFIKNKNSFNVRYDLVNVPVSFADGEQSLASLPNVRLSNLPTQGVATSFYKSEFVRTALLHT